MTDKPRLSTYIVADATPAELARQWAAIQPRLAPQPRRRWLPLSLVLAGAATAAVVYVLTQPTPPKLVATQPNERVTLALDDGSHMQVRPASQVSLLRQSQREVRLQVLHGSARFDVRHDPSRRFVVTAADLDVVVTGTAFSVELASPARTVVAVERGEVEVHARGEDRLLARLNPGETWPPPAPAAEAPVAASPAPAAPAAVPPPAAEAPVATPPPAGKLAASAAARAADLPSPAVQRPAPSDPRQLLEEANAARRRGDVERAATLLETLRLRHPRDARAALATFELGRLRLDGLGDLPGAVAALKQSIALAPSGVFREDAEACLATAYARMHDRARCEQARQGYLVRYPAGTHQAEMAALVCRER